MRKLECFTGAATFFTTIIYYFYTEYLPLSAASEQSSKNINSALLSFIFIIGPGLLLLVGLYLHIIKQSRDGQTLVYVCSIVLALLFGLQLFSGAAFYYLRGYGILLIFPVSFATTTIYAAYRNQGLLSLQNLGD